MTNTTEIDSYEPDYNTGCDVCGQTPTVTLVKNGKTVEHTEMCGPCTWGEADCIDPDNWS